MATIDELLKKDVFVETAKADFNKLFAALVGSS
jgi:hypothetical protein